MADSVSAPLADHLERLQGIPTAADLVERLTAEGLISMKDAAKLYGRATHKSTPTRHHVKGVRLADGTVIRLEAIRVSGALATSRAAVLRFFSAQNQAPASPPPALATATPKQRQRAAASASKKADAIFGTAN
jgi:hypothetical protein